MLRNLLLGSVAFALLGGCADGWQWLTGSDPNAAQAVQSAEPLIQQCREHFVAWLDGTPVTWEGGPTVTRVGTFTAIQLEAQPTAPTAIDAKVYRCEFDNGQPGIMGPVP